MNFDLFDLTGFVGVLLIVIAYLLLQLDKLPSSFDAQWGKSLLNGAVFTRLVYAGV
jgi:hypothetical protein